MKNGNVIFKSAVSAFVALLVLLVPAYMAFNDAGLQPPPVVGLSVAESVPGLPEPTTTAPAATQPALGGDENAAHLATTHVEGATTATTEQATTTEETTTTIPEIVISPYLSAALENPATDRVILQDDLVEEDSVNILILGLDREAFLTDTIGIASVSESTKTIKLIMFPRDTYIEYSDTVKEAIQKVGHAKLPGEYKLNNVYNVGKNVEEKFPDLIFNNGKFKEAGFDFLSQVVYEKFDIVVDEYVRINTYGFIKLVDLFGGVTVTVPVTMRYVDPDQGLNINLKKGTYTLTGAQAEGFVRFRQGYDSAGRLSVYQDRTKNQIAFMKAFFQQHVKLSNIDKVPEVISTLKKNLVFSFSAGDIFTQYLGLLTRVVMDQEYVLESYEFETKDKKINGSNYMVIVYKDLNPDDDEEDAAKAAAEAAAAAAGENAGGDEEGAPTTTTAPRDIE